MNVLPYQTLTSQRNLWDNALGMTAAGGIVLFFVICFAQGGLADLAEKYSDATEIISWMAIAAFSAHVVGVVIRLREAWLSRDLSKWLGFAAIIDVLIIFGFIVGIITGGT